MEAQVTLIVGGWSGTLVLPSAGLAVGLPPNDVQFEAYQMPHRDDLLISRETARALARTLVDGAHEGDEAGLSADDVETCVTLVRGLLDRWAEKFENDEEINGGDLVAWFAEEVLPAGRLVSWPGD